MLRILLVSLIPLALPAAAWFAWRHLSPRAAGRSGRRDAPWHWLGLAGVTLMALTLFALVLLPGG